MTTSNKLEAKQKIYKVAIVGGGISGLYAAMKLKQSTRFQHEDIIVVEKEDRWGGRIDTDVVHLEDEAEFPKIILNSGPMRFNRSCHKKLMKLMEELEVDETDIEHFPTKPLGSTSNRRYFCGQSFATEYAEKNPEVWNRMFSLEGKEQVEGEYGLIIEIYHKLLQHNRVKIQNHFPKDVADDILSQNYNTSERLLDVQDLHFWSFFRNSLTWPVKVEEVSLKEVPAKEVPIKEVPIKDFSVSTLMKAMNYSHGACSMILPGVQGFLLMSPFHETPCGNVGAVLQVMITHSLLHDDHYLTFKKGWKFLIEKLKDKVKSYGVVTRKDCRIVNVTEDKGLFKLEFESQKANLLKGIIAAENVILALPVSAVEKLYPSWLGDDEDAVNRMEMICKATVGCICSRIFFYFDQDWWNEVPGKKMFGGSVTDLPCGTVYPFYQRCELHDSASCACQSRLAVLMFYCDDRNTLFWESLQFQGPSFQSDLQSKERHQKLAALSEPLVREALGQLKKIFDRDEDVPYPILTSYKTWNGTENGHAVHFWAPGVDDSKLESVQPIPARKLYICNEAWSTCQAWVEGSLISTDNVIKKITGE